MYNLNPYTVSPYNGGFINLQLTDTLTSSDFIDTEDYKRLLVESVPLIDNMLRFFNQVDEMALDYFNPTDTATIEANKAAVDAVATTDAPVVVSFVKILLENMSPADVRTFVYTTSKNESVVLSDFVTKSITNKGLPETLRLKDWISLRKTGSTWYD
jgi:hypothetical protein